MKKGQKFHQTRLMNISSQRGVKELEESLADINPRNIINYDETKLTDEPGRKKKLQNEERSIHPEGN